MSDKRFVPMSDELWRQVRAAAVLDGMTVREWFEKLLTSVFEKRKKNGTKD